MASCMDCMPQDGVLKEEDDDIDEGTFVKRKKKRPRPVQASLRALQRQTMLDMLRATQNDLEELREEVDRNHAEIRRLQGETNSVSFRLFFIDCLTWSLNLRVQHLKEDQVC